MRADQIVGDYIPSDPTGVMELPAAYAEFAAGFTEAERTHGPARATLAPRAIRDAARRRCVRAGGDPQLHDRRLRVRGARRTAVALDVAQPGNCGITIIRYRTGLPPALAPFNDVGHLNG